jgi:hypothetical protein
MNELFAQGCPNPGAWGHDDSLQVLRIRLLLGTMWVGMNTRLRCRTPYDGTHCVVGAANQPSI